MNHRDSLNPAPGPLENPVPLSEGEGRVLALLAKGHSYASVAATLGIRLGTVQTYVKRIYRKLGVSSKTEAAWRMFGKGAVAFLLMMDELELVTGTGDLLSPIFATANALAG